MPVSGWGEGGNITLGTGYESYRDACSFCGYFSKPNISNHILLIRVLGRYSYNVPTAYRIEQSRVEMSRDM